MLRMATKGKGPAGKTGSAHGREKSGREKRSTMKKAASGMNRAAPLKPGAGNESRTRDLNLGKVALYQLSYSRIEEDMIIGGFRFLWMGVANKRHGLRRSPTRVRVFRAHQNMSTASERVIRLCQNASSTHARHPSTRQRERAARSGADEWHMRAARSGADE